VKQPKKTIWAKSAPFREPVKSRDLGKVAHAFGREKDFVSADGQYIGDTDRKSIRRRQKRLWNTNKHSRTHHQRFMVDD
jgi:hypothetical protein